MTDCLSDEILLAYLADELDAEASSKVRAHARDCPSWRALLESWAALPAATELNSPASENAFVARVMTQLPAARSSLIDRFLDTWYPYFAATASVLVWGMLVSSSPSTPTTETLLLSGVSAHGFELAVQSGTVGFEDLVRAGSDSDTRGAL